MFYGCESGAYDRGYILHSAVADETGTWIWYDAADPGAFLRPNRNGAGDHVRRADSHE